jgi:5-methylcytosine-specific restriction endonuclease McrA
MDVLNEKVLVLNKNFFVLCTISVKAAMRLVFGDKALIMDEFYNGYDAESWRDNMDEEGRKVIRTPKKAFVIPEVIRLTEFDKILSRPINLTRQNVFIRDDFICQYCGSQDKAMTIDHVIPKSRAADFDYTRQQINAWENVTTCCKKCNNKKDCKTPKEAGMKLLSIPRRPKYTVLGFEPKQIKPIWKAYLKGKK